MLRFRFAVLVCLLCVPAAFAERKIEKFRGKDAVAGEVLVKFRNAGPNSQRDVDRDADAESSKQVGRSPELRLIRSRTKNIEALIARLAARADVEFVEPNLLITVEATPADTYFTSLWGLHNTGAGGGLPGADIEAPAAWDITKGSARVAVGVIDTGIDYNHPDLVGNLWSAPAAFTVALAGQSITCPAGSRGFDAINFTCDPADEHGHGTHVAGTIGASGNNGVGVTGVNWTTSMIGVKMMDATGNGTTAEAVNAIDFLIQAKAAFAGTATPLDVRVMSASWGSSGYSQSMFDAIARANAADILFVAAAGNSNSNTDLIPFYPANYDVPNVISVAATDRNDAKATFSSYGLTTVDLAAPGATILSTRRGGTYVNMSGTSMATPHVSGVAALALSVCQLDTAALRNLLLRSVDPVASMTGITVTGGRLNALKTVRGCSIVSPAGTFVLSTPQGTRSVLPTQLVSYSVIATSQEGFTGSVGLSVSGLPTGVTAAFLKNPLVVTSGSAVSTSLKLTVGASVIPGTYNLLVTAVSGTITQTLPLKLIVTAPTFTLATTPTSQTVPAGQPAMYSATLTPGVGFSGAVVLAVTGLPSGATATFGQNPVSLSATASTPITITTSPLTPVGTYRLTVAASSGAIRKTSVVTLVVTSRL